MTRLLQRCLAGRPTVKHSPPGNSDHRLRAAPINAANETARLRSRQRTESTDPRAKQRASWAGQGCGRPRGTGLDPDARAAMGSGPPLESKS